MTWPASSSFCLLRTMDWATTPMARFSRVPTAALPGWGCCSRSRGCGLPDLDARRSVLFVAWGGGQLVPSGVEEWLSDSANFRHLPSVVQNKPAMLFQLDGLGSGNGELELYPGSSLTLSRLLKTSAVEVGASVETSTLTAAEYGEVVTRRMPWVWMRWAGADVPPDRDTLDRIQVDRCRPLVRCSLWH